MHSPQSQSFFQRYRSNLPTSLVRVTLSTKGCSPRRPDAVLGTAAKGVTFPGFSKAIASELDIARRAILFPRQTSSTNNSIRRSSGVKRSRVHLPMLALASEFCCVTTDPLNSKGIFAFFPFKNQREISTLKARAFPLGPANPRTIAVHVEPLSTTVIKGFI